MIELGVKRKDLYGKEKPSSEKDWESEVVYPEFQVEGKLAEKMGAAELKEGDAVEVPVVLKVKRHCKTEEDGKVRYCMTLCITKMSDEMNPVDDDEDDDLAGESLPERSPVDVLRYDEAE
jgi:hypothetical protein